MNPSDAELTQATPSFMFVALLRMKYIWKLLTEVEPINSSPYSYNTLMDVTGATIWSESFSDVSSWIKWFFKVFSISTRKNIKTRNMLNTVVFKKQVFNINCFSLCFSYSSLCFSFSSLSSKNLRFLFSKKFFIS